MNKFNKNEKISSQSMLALHRNRKEKKGWLLALVKGCFIPKESVCCFFIETEGLSAVYYSDRRRSLTSQFTDTATLKQVLYFNSRLDGFKSLNWKVTLKMYLSKPFTLLESLVWDHCPTIKNLILDQFFF